MAISSTKLEWLAEAGKKELLPNLVDAIAATQLGAIFAEYPIHPTSYNAGYQKFSYGTFANAINVPFWVSIQQRYPKKSLMMRRPLLWVTQSKFITENILNYASKQDELNNIDIEVARVGQIAGPAYTSGIWNQSEWLPSLAITSFNMGFIPENLGSENIKLDWVSIYILSSALVYISFDVDRKASDSSARVFHPLNQSITTWKPLLLIILNTLNASSPEAQPAITSIKHTCWLQKLRDVARESALSSIVDLPEILLKHLAIKLLEGFEALSETKWAENDMGEALKASEHLRDLRGIELGWVEKWVKEWI